MNGISPITIASDSSAAEIKRQVLQFNYGKEKSEEALSRSSSFDSSWVRQFVAGNTSPTVSEKVQNWMKGLSGLSTGKESSNDFIRYDFDKTMDNHLLSRENILQVAETSNAQIKEYYYKLSPNKSVYCREINLKPNEDERLSPESQKRELCKYLQLMKPGERKRVFTTDKNRRSNRVKNLTLQQEKQKQAMQTVKSEEEVKNKTFSFPKPPKKLQKKTHHFEEAMEIRFDPKIVEKEKVSEKKPTKPLLDKKAKPNSIDKKAKPLVNKIEKPQNLVKESIEKKEKKPIANVPKPQSAQKPKAINVRKVEKMKQRIKKMNGTINNLKRRLIRSRSSRRNGDLRNVQIDKLLLSSHKINKKSLKKKKQIFKPKQIPKQNEPVKPTEKTDDVDVDMANLMDDVNDFNNLSEEHKKCLIVSRTLSKKPMQEALKMQNFNKTLIVALDNSLVQSEVDKSSAPAENDKNDSEKIKMIRKKLNEVEALSKAAVDYREFEEFFKTFSSNDKVPQLQKNGEQMNSLEMFNRFEAQFHNQHLQEFIREEKNKLVQMLQNQEAPFDDKSTEVPLPVKGKTYDHVEEHNYANLSSDLEDDLDSEPPESDRESTIIESLHRESPVSIESIPESPLRSISPPKEVNNCSIIPFVETTRPTSLLRSLSNNQKKKPSNTLESTNNNSVEWDSDSSSNKARTKPDHAIFISKDNGPILKAFYTEFNLIVCQEFVVSFWNQSPLGNVLGAQDMWIPRGCTQRIKLNGKCVQKDASEMVISTENSVAFVELWMKEHKSEVREYPVADVFAVLYFWRLGQNGLEKKVLQLENINGFADDVQYVVMTNTPKIIVSWHSVTENNKSTFIHSYQLASDYGIVANITEIQPVKHYVSSLHNVEDCGELIMGCGENQITLWNIDYGYIVETIQLSDIKSPLSTFCAKSDRGFLFMIQQCVDNELRLIAINGLSKGWKRLKTFNPPPGYERLRGVIMENGVVLAIYDKGILCWNAKTGEIIFEDFTNETEYIASGKYLIMLINNNQIVVRHAVTYLINSDES